MIHLFYALIASLASIAGGVLPLYTRIKDIKTHYLVGFAAGVLISTALFEMLPQALAEMEPSDVGVPLALGFFSLYVIEKVAMIHACRETECDIHHAGWAGILGLGLESLLDGMAITAGYFSNPVLGFYIAIAVIVHELPVGFSTSIIMRSAGYNIQKSTIALLITSFLTVVGALLAQNFPATVFGPLLVFTAGSFLYIGAGDLLPEAHRSLSWSVVATVIAGASLIPLIGLITGF